LPDTEESVADVAGSDQVNRHDVVMVTLPEVTGPWRDSARLVTLACGGVVERR